MYLETCDEPASSQPTDATFDRPPAMRSAGGHGRAPPGREGRRTGEDDFEVPVVLMTFGWDPFGDPTHGEKSLGRDRSCVFRVLAMERVVKWFTSHTRYDSHTNEKVFSWDFFVQCWKGLVLGRWFWSLDFVCDGSWVQYYRVAFFTA